MERKMPLAAVVVWVASSLGVTAYLMQQGVAQATLQFWGLESGLATVVIWVIASNLERTRNQTGTAIQGH